MGKVVLGGGKKKSKGGMGNWEKERKEFITEKRCRVKEVDRRKGGRTGQICIRFVAVDKERQRRKRWEMINGSKYNRWY